MIWDLINKDAEVTNVQMREIHTAPVSPGPEPAKKKNFWRPEAREPWVRKIWEIVKPVFERALNNGHAEMHHDAPELRNAMTNAGESPNSLSPAFTHLIRMGLIVRTGRGMYAMKR
jgi:hypothetical protein